ncbi:hypothetical protein ARMSODRAFT_1028488 [Armillaria solidipes]|uniref:Uncharacterized protein n=1 Tax=Armillaria solidipes TaxID=1076256 RepID=A0A2H3AN02_9AGAR|nr:hypothetical protein ARMSODRAFT_1028488 [Armillaria solidipes]
MKIEDIAFASAFSTSFLNRVSILFLAILSQSENSLVFKGKISATSHKEALLWPLVCSLGLYSTSDNTAYQTSTCAGLAQEITDYFDKHCELLQMPQFKGLNIPSLKGVQLMDRTSCTSGQGSKHTNTSSDKAAADKAAQAVQKDDKPTDTHKKLLQLKTANTSKPSFKPLQPSLKLTGGNRNEDKPTIEVLDGIFSNNDNRDSESSLSAIEDKKEVPELKATCPKSEYALVKDVLTVGLSVIIANMHQIMAATGALNGVSLEVLIASKAVR